jgi:hypothetical protein
MGGGGNFGLSAPSGIDSFFNSNVNVTVSGGDGKWGKEERHRLPFAHGRGFDLRIIVTNNTFEV